jgi:hypothetical protein
MRSVILTVLGLVALTVAVPIALPPLETDIEATDRLVFNSTMAEFIQARAAKTPATLDWTSDGCSSADDDPFDFQCTIFFTCVLILSNACCSSPAFLLPP